MQVFAGERLRVDPGNVDEIKITADIVSFLALSKEDGAWKIGKEKIQASRIRHDGRSSSQGSGGQNVQFNFGGGGAVLMNPNDDLLPRDIGQRPGGCANGRCGL